MQRDRPPAERLLGLVARDVENIDREVHQIGSFTNAQQ